VDRPDQAHRPDPRADGLDRAVEVRDPRRHERLTPTSETSVFRFAQVELPWALGPADGRYLIRRPEDPPDAPPSHVLVLATLGAPERRLIERRKRRRDAPPEPEPAAVVTGRATVIDVGHPLSVDDARRWLADAGEEDLERELEVLNRALHVFRVVTADPYMHTIARRQALVARIGFGAGDEVAEGLWSEAQELIVSERRRRRSVALQPQAQLSAVLTGKDEVLACQELILRARFDLDHGRMREAALQVLVALDAAIAELAGDSTTPRMSERLDELRGRRDAAAQAGQAALSGPLGEDDVESVEFTLKRLEAAFRARAVARS
jgi:hypothetical protein